MDTISQATDTMAAPQPVTEATSPVAQPDANVANQVPRLEQQGEQTAPAPTSGTDGQDTAASTPEAPQFDVDEFLRIKREREQFEQELQAERGITAQIRQMAEQQQAMAAQQQLRSEIQQEVLNDLKRAGVDDEDVAKVIAERLYGRLDSTRTEYQQQMTEYQQNADTYVKDALWAGLKDSFAQDTLNQMQLDPVFLPSLKQATSEAEMIAVAKALKANQQFYKQQAYDRTVATQEEQRRASGVDTVHGTNSGPLIGGELKPGRNLDVLSALLTGTGAR